MKLPLTISEFVVLSLAVQSMVMAVVLLIRARELKGNGWIAGIIFSVSVCGVIRVIFGGLNLQGACPWLVPLVFSPHMLIGPFVYFYTRALLHPEGTNAKKWLHFLPAIKGAGPQIGFILFYSGLLYVPFVQNIYFSSAAQGLLFNVYTIDNLPTLLSLVVYAVLSYRLVKRNMADVAASPYKLKDTKWLKHLLHLFFGLTALYLLTVIVNFVPPAHIADFKNIVFFIPITAFTYWLSIAAYIRKRKMSEEDVSTYNKVPTKVYFNEQEAEKYTKQLLELMEQEQLYLDPLLKLDTLAARLNITDRAFSNLLNQHMGKNFNDFVNQYRVEAAKLKLANQDFDQYTIAAIAYDCGFNSLATFQRCFKQFAGTTPSKYMQQRKAADQLFQQQ